MRPAWWRPPLPVALHRYLEGIIPVSGEWPLDTRRLMQNDPSARTRRLEQSARLDSFIRRALDEGYLRADVDAVWARSVLDQLVDTVDHRFPDLDPPQAADLVASTLLNGLGTA